MNKFFQIICAFLISTVNLDAQNYQFDYYPQNYQYLQGDSSISENIPWYNEVWELPIGFSFKFMGHDFTQLKAWNEGIYFDLDLEDLFIEPYGAYLLDKGYVTPGTDILSPVSVLHDGQPGNRIFKIQYRNAGFEDGGAQDSVNFQIWLYETSNVVEIHFGARNIVSNVWQDASQGPLIALVSFVDNSALIMEGDANMPVAQFLNPNDTTATSVGLLGAPPQNTVWRFTPTILNKVSALPNQLNINIAPNPFGNTIQIENYSNYENLKINVFDVTGNLVLTQTLTDNNIDLSHLAKGTYAFELISGSKKVIKKIIKQE